MFILRKIKGKTKLNSFVVQIENRIQQFINCSLSILKLAVAFSACKLYKSMARDRTRSADLGMSDRMNAISLYNQMNVPPE